MKLKDKVSLITGAGSGMGREIALLFALEGSKVIATDINSERLEQLEKEIKVLGGKVTTLLMDVAKEEEIEKTIDSCISIYGTLDILVNNAGIMDHNEGAGELNNKIWERVMKINLDGPFKASRSAIRKVFLSKQEGVIVNISSLAGINGARGGTAYTVSKHGVIGLTKSIGYLYSQSGIRCNAILPGAVNTNISETIDANKINPLIQKGMTLIPRVGEPSEIAKAALFLASDDASFINGESLVVDGGWNAY